MAFILSLETATRTCSVALHKDENLLAVQHFHVDKSHSAILHPIINNLLDYTETDRKQLSALAVSAGPGSYTGLRIGVSAAKGICFGLDIPLIAIDTLEAMAHDITKYNLTGAWLCPMLDARRMEVYCQIRDAEEKLLMSTRPLILDENSFKNDLENQQIIFFGDGSDKCRPLLEPLYPNSLFIKGVLPSAASVGSLAIDRYKKGSFDDTAYFTPNYLKEFRATKPKKRVINQQD